MTFPHVRRPGRPGALPRRLGLLFIAVLPLVACDDPFRINWSSVPDTALLYSLARPELNLASGFNFYQERTVRIEAPTSSGEVDWDVVLDTDGGQLVLLPPTALGVDTRAGVATLTGVTLEEVRRAPRDTASFVTGQPIPLETGVIYVVRTNQRIASFGQRCVHYAKVEPIALDPANGSFRFAYVLNPVCNDPALVPPE